MRLISLDSLQKADHFLALVRSDNAPYFWSGGELSFDSRTLNWQNGAVEEVRRGQHPWSFTGRTGPQPDGGERCVAILNNTYRYTGGCYNYGSLLVWPKSKTTHHWDDSYFLHLSMST